MDEEGEGDGTEQGLAQEEPEFIVHSLWDDGLPVKINC